jgi:hypothetical protein
MTYEVIGRVAPPVPCATFRFLLHCIRRHPCRRAQADIPNLEPVLTVVGGRIVDAAAEYERLNEESSSSDHHGARSLASVAIGSQSKRATGPSGQAARQVIAESEQQRKWQVQRGFTPGNSVEALSRDLSHSSWKDTQ